MRGLPLGEAYTLIELPLGAPIVGNVTQRLLTSVNQSLVDISLLANLHSLAIGLSPG